MLLSVVFFLVYFGEDDSPAVELTAPVAEEAAGLDSDSPAVPTESAVSPEVAAEVAAPALRAYVAGSVRNPGVYPLASGQRLVDVVDAAGGATDDADLEAVNLAMRVEDEGYYYIPAKVAQPVANINRELMDNVPPTPRFPEAATNRPAPSTPDKAVESVDDSGESAGLLDLNTATQAELETLPSIGPARARTIVAYREQNGPFAAVEEITAVSGIGQGILDNLQGLITVGDSP
jgi:competence protein ComEA